MARKSSVVSSTLQLHCAHTDPGGKIPRDIIKSQQVHTTWLRLVLCRCLLAAGNWGILPFHVLRSLPGQRGVDEFDVCLLFASQRFWVASVPGLSAGAVRQQEVNQATGENHFVMILT